MSGLAIYLKQYTKLIYILLLIFSSAASSCEIEIEGSEFLKQAHTNGVKYESDCHSVNLPENQFHAPPEESCLLAFSSVVWLKEGWMFNRIEGIGKFYMDTKDNNHIVIIEEGSGYRLSSVKVSSDQENCPDINVVDVIK